MLFDNLVSNFLVPSYTVPYLHDTYPILFGAYKNEYHKLILQLRTLLPHLLLLKMVEFLLLGLTYLDI